MREFRLSDGDLVALGAGRPSGQTLAELRRAQISRHLLQLGALPEIPSWYARKHSPADLADPMTALHTTATRRSLRAGGPPPPDRVWSDRYLTSTHEGLTLRLRLEDTDPLRAALGLTPAPRLPGEAVHRWQTLLDEAWRLLTTRHRPAAESIAAVLTVLVPVEPDPGAAGISATSAEAYGAVALSEPADPTALAVGLLHETQHSVLNAFRILFDLVTPVATRGYSPWRDDPRPPFGLLHGAYAYQAVTRLWRTESTTDPADRRAAFEFARWRAAVTRSVTALLTDDLSPTEPDPHAARRPERPGGGEAPAVGALLTPAGRRLVEAMRDEVAPWLEEPVEDEVQRLADEANEDHRLRWRLRHLEVAPATVAALAAAFEAGHPPPPLPEPALRPSAGRRLERSERLRRVHESLKSDQESPAGSRVWPQTDAHAGVTGGTGLSPYNMVFWCDLALTHPLPALRARPEAIRALHEAMPAADPLVIARWLSARD